MELVVARAKELGAKKLYVSSTPSRHSVRFYHGQGFALTDSPDPELFALEPEDIQLVRTLWISRPPMSSDGALSRSRRAARFAR